MARTNEDYGRLAAAIYRELCAAKFNVEELTKLGEAIFAEIDLEWALQRKKIPPAVLAKLFRVAQRLDPQFDPQFEAQKLQEEAATASEQPKTETAAATPTTSPAAPAAEPAAPTTKPAAPAVEASPSTEKAQAGDGAVASEAEPHQTEPRASGSEEPAPGTNGSHSPAIPPSGEPGTVPVSVGKW